MQSSGHLSPLDLVILIAFLASAIAWGLWPKSGAGSAIRYGDYLLGGRQVAWPLLLFSIIATETSTVTFLSLPGLSFKEGGDLTFLQIALGYVVGRFIVIGLLLPFYFNRPIFTAYEALEERFGRGARRVASALFLLCRTAADGLRLLLAGLALEQMLGWGFVPCVLTITVVTTVYAVAGGVRSVIWNDTLQLGVYTAGALVASWVLLAGVPDGLLGVLRYGSETGRWDWLDLSPGFLGSGVTFWSGLIGGGALSVATHGVDHLMVQRYLCARSQRHAAIALGLSGPLVALQFFLFLSIGVGLAAYYAANGGAEGLAPDQAFAAFLAGAMPVGVRGLLCASVLAAGMSTMSSSLNSSAGVLINDLVGANKSDEASAEDILKTRLATVLFAALQTGVALTAWAMAYKSSVIGSVLAIAGFTTGVIAGLFLLGALLKQPKPNVAVAALVVGSLLGVGVFGWNAAVNAGSVGGETINSWWNTILAVSATAAGGLLAQTVMKPARKALTGFLLFTAAASAQAAGLPLVEPAEAGMNGELLERVKIEARAEHEAGQFAGCVVAIGRGDQLTMLWAHGDRQVVPEHKPMRVDTVFDLASLTKPVATATSVFRLVERGQVRLGDRIDAYLPEIADEAAAAITVEQLLTHHSGHIPDNSLEDYRDGIDQSWRRLFALKPADPPGTRFRYSDVNFELLGKLVERVSGQTLDAFARGEIYRPLGMDETGYLPAEALRERAAATEPRDGQMCVGVVHDPRAAALGGIAGHAGLFSTAADLSRYAAMLLNGGELDGVRVLGPATVREMTRPRDVSGARRSAGWDMLSPYSSNRGELMSDSAFGHGGFTGVAMWIDPENDLFVIFLANRLHPDGVGTVNKLAGRIGSIAAAAVLND